MGGHDLHRPAIHFLVLFHADLVDFRSQAGRPAGITSLELDLVCSGQLEDAAHSLGQGGLGRVYGASHQAGNGDVALFRSHDGHIDGGFREAFHGAAHPDHVGRAGQQGLDSPQHHAVLDILGGGGNLLHDQLGGRVRLGEFGLDLGEGILNALDDGIHILFGQDQLRLGLEGDGVAEAAAGEAHYLDAEHLHHGKEHAGHYLVGVGAVQGDVHAGVAALQALDGYLQAFAAFGRIVLAEFEAGLDIQAAGAAYAQFAFFLGVQVEEDVSLQQAGSQGIGSVHAGFFRVGGQKLQGTVLDGGIFRGGHRQGQADAVIGPEGGAVCRHPFAVHVGADGVFQEIVPAVRSFLGYHIHMALQDHSFAVLHAGGGGDADNHVGNGTLAVLDGFETMGDTPVIQVVYYLFLVIGGTRKLGESIEVLPDYLGFKFLNTHCSVFCFIVFVYFHLLWVQR